MSLTTGPIKIDVDISWGRKSMDCKRFGICIEVFLVTRVAAAGCLATMTFDPEAKTLLVAVAENEIVEKQPEKLPYFQDQSFFVMEETWTPQPSTLDALGIENAVAVAPGSYPLLFHNGIYSVLLPLG